MFFFAYNGSITGDWVSHYAVQLAAVHEDRQLNLLHVRDGNTREVELDAKLQRLATECEQARIELACHILEPDDSVLKAILSGVPRGPEHYLLCGTRIGQSKRGILSGTTSEQLLRCGRCNVLAVHVVQPGLLGLPRRLLLPTAAHSHDFSSGFHFLQLFVPQVSCLQIVSVVQVGRWRFSRMSHATTERLRLTGCEHCKLVERDISKQLGVSDQMMDAHVVVSDDVPKEIVIVANKTKSRLIYMGASKRNLTERFFYGNPVEQVLRDSTCDVAIYRGVE